MNTQRIGETFLKRHIATVDWFIRHRQEAVAILLKRRGRPQRNLAILIRYVTTNDTLQVVSDDYNLTRERTRQIVNQQLDYLRKELDDGKKESA